MKIQQILEAKLVDKKPLKDEAPKLPKLKRQGDFVWFLYKFFNADQREPVMTINDNFAQEAMGPIIAIIEQYKRKFSKSKIWPRVDSKDAAAGIISQLKPKRVPERENEPYEEFDWGSRAEYDQWIADMEQEYQQEVQDFERAPYDFGYRSHQSLAKYWKANHPSAVFAEINDRVLELIGSGNLPHPFEMTEAELRYEPKPEYVIRFNVGDEYWAEIDWLRVKINQAGELIRIEIEDDEYIGDDGPKDKKLLDAFAFHGYRKKFRVFKSTEWDDHL